MRRLLLLVLVAAASLLAGGTISAAAREAGADSPAAIQIEKTVRAARGAPDLVVSALSRPPAALERTTGLEVATTVKNVGPGKAAASTVRFYLSADRKKGKGDVLLVGAQQVTPLARRSSLAAQTTVTVPGSTRIARYYVLACADDQGKIRERSERNNCRAAPGRVAVTAAKKPADTTSSASELIDAAVAKKKISAETGVIYKVFAEFADPRLPPEYRGPAGAASDSGLMMDVGTTFDKLSARAQKTLAPFFVPPFHHHSWWAMRRGIPASPSGKRLSASEIRPCGGGNIQDLPLDTFWGHVDSQNGRVKVWWQERYPTDEAVAKNVARWADEVWLKLTALMGREALLDDGSDVPCRGGDDRLDISLVDVGRSYFSPYGLVDCSEVPGAIMLGRATVRPGSVAHELMHAFQYAFKHAGSCSEYRWWEEATADWAVEHVYPRDNLEWSAVASFLWHPDLPLEFRNDEHEYGANVFAFFLARTVRPELIRTSWEYMGRYSDSLEAINAAIPGEFEEQWPKFVFHTWNREPWDYYNQWDPGLGCRGRSSSGGACARTGGLDGSVGSSDAEIPVRLDGANDKEFKLTGTVAHLAARYVDFKFNEDAVRSVSFYNGFSSGDPQHNKVQALVKIEGQEWKREDWSGRKGQAFCRDASDERLEELVVVLSNSRFEDRGAAAPVGDTKLIATNVGCWRFRGTVTAKADASASGEIQDETTTVTDVVLERIRPAGTPADDPPTVESFRVASGNAHWSGHVSGDCTGQASRDYSLADGPGALRLYPYAGPADPAEAKLGYVAGEIAFQGMVTPIPLTCQGGAETVSPALTAWWLLTYDPTLPAIKYQKVAADGSLKGSARFDYAEPNGTVTGTWEWDLKPERQ